MTRTTVLCCLVRTLRLIPHSKKLDITIHLEYSQTQNPTYACFEFAIPISKMRMKQKSSVKIFIVVSVSWTCFCKTPAWVRVTIDGHTRNVLTGKLTLMLMGPCAAPTAVIPHSTATQHSYVLLRLNTSQLITVRGH